MPELPDVMIYVEAVAERVVGATLERVRVLKPFLVRTYDPPIEETFGKRVFGVRRVGKRVVLEFDDELFAVIHLMIAGRLHWKPAGAKPPGKIGLAAFDFSTGTLTLTEAGTKRRAMLHVVRGLGGLAMLNPGGVEPLEIDLATFRKELTRENHTLKRTLTDPRTFSGIGNSFSDEILHAAGLSPLALTQKLGVEQIERLFEATRRTLTEWTDRLRKDSAGRFPENVTAFRPEMAVHGKFGQPCPKCKSLVQRIVYAENEVNYCPRCQTGGKILADRSLSRLLKNDWPKSIDEVEADTSRLV